MYVCVCMYVYVHMYVYVCMCVYVCIYVYVYMYVCMYACMYACTMLPIPQTNYSRDSSPIVYYFDAPVVTHCPVPPAGKLLQVNTGDSEVLYYEAPRGKQQLLNKEDTEEISWSSWTCVLGPSVQGVWPAYTDVTDVNAACVSHDGKVVATGDDFGYVKLFQYPSYVSIL